MLSVLVLGTLVAGFATFAFPRAAGNAAKWFGVVVAAAGVVLLLLASPTRGALDERVRWLAMPFTASYHLGNDGIGWTIALVLAVITVCALLATRVTEQRNFVAQMLLLDGTMLGLFLSKDLLLFALFWDAQLIPVFLLMLGWPASRHGENATAAAWKYLIYNFAGGLLLLVAVAAFGILYGTTDVIGAAPPTSLGGGWAQAIFIAFAIAFLVKTPVWPLHTWSPDAYADLPFPAAAMVGGIQSKGGLFGLLAIGVPLFPDAAHAAAPVMLTLGTIGLVYGAFVALRQTDIKRVIAYSSLSHLGLIVVAIFSFNELALRGALVYIVAHALFSAALFLSLGYVETREETRSLTQLGGLGRRNPKLAGAIAIAALAALGLPGLCGFAGELLILTGIYRAGLGPLAIVALVPIVLAAAYMLRVYQGVMHGPEVDDLPQRRDLSLIEGLALAPLVLLIAYVGINPGPIANVTDNALRSPAVVPMTAGVGALAQEARR